MKLHTKTMLILLCPFIVLAGEARAENDFAPRGAEIDPIFRQGFEAIDCSTRPPPATSRAEFNGITYVGSGGGYLRTGDMRSYLDIFGVVPPPGGSGPPSFAPFPGNGATQKLIWNLPPSTFAAMAFTVPQTLAASTTFQIQFLQETFLPQNRIASLSISECPGDFQADILPVCKAEWDGNDGGSIILVADDSPLSASATCRLARGKTYYLNVIGATLAIPTTPTCTSITCSMGVIARMLIP